MADWQRTLNIAAEWALAREREIAAQQMARIISERLKALKPFGAPHQMVDDDREELANDFADFAQDMEADYDDLDHLLTDLYDWADRPLDNRFGGKKVCWIKTH